MRLSGMSIRQRDKAKKAIIMGTSIFSIITLTGICCFNLFRSANLDAMKIAKSLVAGPIMQRVLQDGAEFKLDLSEDKILQLEDYLASLGYGYKESNLIATQICSEMDIDYEFQEEVNGNGVVISLESLYCYYEGKDLKDKPEVVENPGEKPEIKVEIEETKVVEGVTVYGARAYFVGLTRTGYSPKFILGFNGRRC